VGNAILPDIDPDPLHEGIEKIDRTTVPELQEIVASAEALQTGLDNAEAHLSPLGIPHESIAFDINPAKLSGGNPATHFEQIYERATGALRNAVAAFDDAKDVTRLLRSEQDSLAELQARVAAQELAFTHSLTELYGTPYNEDIGPGKTYSTGYEGPDLVHYSYVDVKELNFPGVWENPRVNKVFRIDIQGFPDDWTDRLVDHQDIVQLTSNSGYSDEANQYREGDEDDEDRNPLWIEYELSSHGFFEKPGTWTGKRESPGRIQQAISEIIQARNLAYQALTDADGAKADVDKALQKLELATSVRGQVRKVTAGQLGVEQSLHSIQFALEAWKDIQNLLKSFADHLADVQAELLPQSLIAGLAAGGDTTSAGRAAAKAAKQLVWDRLDNSIYVKSLAIKSTEFGVQTASRWLEYDQIEPEQWNQSKREAVLEVGDLLWKMQLQAFTINQRLQELDDARRAFRTLEGEGERIQKEREIARKRAAALTQGFRTRDVAFRVFRSEKLERYKTLFELAARYALLAANAYDYETGQLHTGQGRGFLNRIVASRALGIVRNGEPQFAGSNTGDPGLSSALAEMKADWDVLKGRLGFNNPDGYGTTVSLRRENFRILPNADGAANWRNVLEQARRRDLREDGDVRRYCMQLNGEGNLPVPGLVLEFSTTIADGLNLFGRSLAPGDHAFSSASFATKLFAAGVSLEGYVGMDRPAVNGAAINGAGAVSPLDPSVTFLHPGALSATPYVYLIPVGVDAMRSPPLGDASVIRTWNVQDVTIPLPFNIGASSFSTKQLWQSSDSLSEELFAPRKHQSFRPVPSDAYFSQSIYGSNGHLQPSQYTNRRLIGRSVWNSKWKLVIPGHSLLNDPNEGLERFIHSVSDIRLNLVTYSYAGN
jgi:hypothetical protein